MEKKKRQLGMNPSTAANRLVKDVLFKLIQDTGNNTCHQCSESMCRDTFSIEHVTPWLDSEDPVGLYFDLDNISFSHRSCNSAAARRGKGYTEEEALEARRASNRRSWSPEKRRSYYERSGR